MAALLSLPPSPAPFVQRRRLARSDGRAAVYRCSSSSRTPNPLEASVEEPTVASPSGEDRADDQSFSESAVKAQTRGCITCGKDEVEKGCNGEGRIQGGIATVPGFGWWPIKAYRPCPGFVESGGRYRRRGQSMDEVAFGRGGRET